MIRLQIFNLYRYKKKMEYWLDLPHIAKWCGDPARRLAQIATTPPSNHAVIMQDADPIGYVRWEKVSAGGRAARALPSLPDDALDIDIFIGEAEKTGRGAGSEALQLVFHHLRLATNSSQAIFCTSIFNRTAQAAVLKAGCRRLSEFDDPEFGKCVIFVRQLN